MNLFKIIFIFSLGLFSLIHCQEMEFAPNVGFHGDFISDKLEFAPNVGFHGDFISDKLDLVFVMDTREGMDQFLKKIFDSRFISQFEDYDWKMAYTNTSVNEYFVKSSDDEGYEKKYAGRNEVLNSKTCGSGIWLWRLGSVALGLHLGSALAVVRGAYGVSNCLAAAGGDAIGSTGTNPDFSDERKRNVAGGRFLPFERRGNPLENYLTGKQEEYEGIFEDTFNKGTAPYNQFDAPQTQEGASDPLIALVLSLVESQGFFRNGSQAVYVVITPKDSEASAPLPRMQDLFQQVHGKDSHLQVILATLTKKSGGACMQKLRSAGVSHPKIVVNLRKSVHGGVQPVDICDSDLANQLARKIKRFVYPIHPGSRHRDRG